MPVRVLVTGRPGVGKTTLVERVVRRLTRPVRGFITREVRRAGRRMGFVVETFSGRRAWLARVGRGGRFRVGRYRVDLDAFEEVVLPELDLSDAARETLVVLDEIGPMELFSNAFRQALRRIFDGPWDVLATVVQRPHPFADALKARPDVVLLTVTRENREALVEEVARRLSRAASSSARGTA